MSAFCVFFCVRCNEIENECCTWFYRMCLHVILLYLHLMDRGHCIYSKSTHKCFICKNQTKITLSKFSTVHHISYSKTTCQLFRVIKCWKTIKKTQANCNPYRKSESTSYFSAVVTIGKRANRFKTDRCWTSVKWYVVVRMTVASLMFDSFKS